MNQSSLPLNPHPLKPQIKISPSTLELYRSYKEGRYEGTPYEVTAQKLVAYLKGERFVTTANTKGTAFHKMLERGAEPFKQANGTYKVTSKRDNAETVFDNYVGRVADRFRELHPDMIYEIPLSIEMELMGYKVISNMRMDALNPFPLKIHDFKTTSKTRGYQTEEDYYPSMQWRMYLLACDDVQDFQYDIFHFKSEPDEKPLLYYSFMFNREIDMEQVVGDYMIGFIKFCEQHNIIKT